MSVPKIVTADDYVEYISILLYSDPGIGKTVFATSSGTRTLHLATEDGAQAGVRQGNKFDTIDCSDPQTGWDTFQDVVKWLQDGNAAKYDWIVPDTATSLQRRIMQDLAYKRADDTSAKNRNKDKFQLDEYGIQQNSFMRIVEEINALPANKLWTAHARMAEDQDGNPYVKPNIHGKEDKAGELSIWLSANVMATGFMSPITYKKKVDGKEIVVQGRQIQWRGNERVRAKDRFDVLGERTVDKNLAQIQNMIFADD